MALQMLGAIPHASAVVDEPAHLTAGYLALVEGDLTVNREHPPFVKALAALPLLWARPSLPPADGSYPPRATEDFEFAYSRAFLYERNDADALLRLARLPVVLLTLAAGVILYAWGRSLHGTGAALAGLALFAFEPNLLAHGRLVTTDMAAALFALGALAALERCLEHSPGAGRLWTRPSILRAAWCGLALGLGLLSRFSVLLLIPLMTLVVLLDGRRRPATRAVHLLLALIVAILVLNAGYGFSCTFFPLSRTPVGGPLVTEPLATMEISPVLRWTPLPVPRPSLEGLDLARHKNRFAEGPGFLNGELSSDGWWSYFTLALAMKTTLPLLLLAVAGLGLVGLAPGAARRGLLLYLLLPAAGFLFLVTALTRAQIGLRYALPSLPFLCLMGGASWKGLDRLRRSRSGRKGISIAGAALVLLLAWHALSAVSIYPYHLAYFNEAAGGPGRGHERLVDSNLDWGQDLVGLGHFMEERGLEGINLYYFGTADPAYYGITRFAPPRPGYFAVSATHLAGVYLPDRDYLAPFRRMEPSTTIGHSIRVYHLPEVPDFLKRPIRR